MLLTHLARRLRIGSDAPVTAWREATGAPRLFGFRRVGHDHIDNRAALVGLLVPGAAAAVVAIAAVVVGRATGRQGRIIGRGCRGGSGCRADSDTGRIGGPGAVAVGAAPATLFTSTLTSLPTATLPVLTTPVLPLPLPTVPLLIAPLFPLPLPLPTTPVLAAARLPLPATPVLRLLFPATPVLPSGCHCRRRRCWLRHYWRRSIRTVCLWLDRRRLGPGRRGIGLWPRPASGR